MAINIKKIFNYYIERVGLHIRFRSLLFYEIYLPIVNYQANKNGVVVKLINKDALLAEHIIAWLTIDKAKMLLSEPGFQLLVAFIDHEVAGTCFLESKVADLDFLDCDIQLPENSAYITHLVVAPHRRGLGVSQHLLQFACNEAERIGKKRVAICCVPDNVSVQNVFFKMNWRKYSTIRYFRFIFVRLYFVLSTEPSVGVMSWGFNVKNINII